MNWKQYFSTALIQTTVSTLQKETEEYYWEIRFNQLKRELESQINKDNTIDEDTKNEITVAIRDKKKYFFKNNANIAKQLSKYNNFIHLLQHRDYEDYKWGFFNDELDYYFEIFNLSLGDKMALYNILNNNDKNKIIDTMQIPKINDQYSFFRFLRILRSVRNSLYHHKNLTIVIDKEYEKFYEKNLINKPRINKKKLLDYNDHDINVLYLLKITNEYYKQISNNSRVKMDYIKYDNLYKELKNKLNKRIYKRIEFIYKF